jgi:hypothetical protein
MLHGRQPPSLADELKIRTERRARQNQGFHGTPNATEQVYLP